MNITIFDVSHGFCGYIVADNGNVILVDCGHDGDNFRPSTHLRNSGCRGIESLIISNYDEDHVSDLPNILNNFHVEVLYRNKSISTTQLENIKRQTGPVSNAMRATLNLADEYSNPVAAYPDYGDLKFETFQNNYPEFTDTNNLSLLTFVEYDGLGVVFTGDLESDGWDRILENSRVQEKLRNVNIFVASHHGRANGYTRRVFDFCSPDIVVISDKQIVHETQKNVYANHANGVPWDGGPDKRYVLTTRNDGHINIRKNLGSGYHISV